MTLNMLLICSYCILLSQSLLLLASSEPVELNRHPSMNDKLPKQHSERDTIYLESLEDLEHVAHLSMRNFNISDEGLLQSSWLMGLGSTPMHKLHQKSTSSALTTHEQKSQLALMLESFISLLRNGHLRRLEMYELESMVRNLNQSPRLNESESGDNTLTGGERLALALKQNGQQPTLNESLSNKTVDSLAPADPLDRCHYLVTIYKYELLEQQRIQHQDELLQLQSSSTPENQSEREGNSQGAPVEFDPIRTAADGARLMRLCQLVVKCQSADEMVNLISGSWQQAANLEASIKTKRWLPEQAEEPRARNLRDSLSMSLAKLCPLILFQLHDNDGLCSVRRDDRPPMITVWAFATLFVTIVSFCSLIGLSITPLLGPTATDSSTSDLSDGSATIKRQSRPMTPADEQRNKACLTLFEGLAVGSLVGSALFSLIPQAFELQERESNQGFLLKALIIFFGIYLFFCSERLMRIILDTRQQRKKKKGHNHRSSNSLPLPSTTADFDLLHQHRHYNQHQHHQLQQHLLHTQSYLPTEGVTSRQNRSSLLRNTTSGDNITNGRLNSAEPALFKARLSPNAGVVCSSTAQHRLLKDKRDDQRQRRQRSQPVNHQHIKIRSRSTTTPATTATTTTPGNGEFKVVNFPSLRQQMLPLDETGGASLDRFTTTTDKQQVLLEQQQQSAKSMASSSKRSVSSSRNRTRRRKTRHQLRSVKRQQRHRLQQLTRHSETDDQLHGSSSSSISLARPNRRRADLTMGDLSTEVQRHTDGSPSGSPDESGAFESEQQPARRKLPANKVLRGHPASSSKSLRRQPEEISLHSRRSKSPSHSHRTSFNIESRPMTSRHLVEISDKQDISTVAWMIILGDGLHNFIDGISIGAAFSESILSGVSISVAVICEEFPHELGDFAVLVSSGMTVHQALGYNFLSACTCYFGMAVGIILGDVNDGASYISALAAGVFLYIALVDMMGELSATLEETSRNSITQTLKLLLLQNIGIFIGISIIFVLSFIDF